MELPNLMTLSTTVTCNRFHFRQFSFRFYILGMEEEEGGGGGGLLPKRKYSGPSALTKLALDIPL